MYIPKHYQMKNDNNIKKFMEEHNFVTIVTVDDHIPIATHVPVMIEYNEDTMYLSGHFAKGNPQWKTIQDNSNILVIFSGPHSYISSSWYEEEDVPTWDYQSVHAYGTGVLLNEAELTYALKSMLNKYEAHRENGATWDKLSNQTLKQIKGVIGFKIKVNRLEAAYKLSQTRSEKEKENIISKLKQSNDNVQINLADEIENYK
ncbi:MULTISPECIES: FMN-binding negative transcriptional regulator [Staphylococcus]|uniref:FMN-binding negative transcriptional regulator n=1 Tax=Staphylococcus TaxID=1279 RepID=UPI00076AFC93|nr:MULTISPECIES: FMN-binding negative transcriptional regulator [Staphylococcus]AMG64328.1 FMN-binding negative transcriptional regulator [Staphylococcus lugdunensis]ARJ26195.1 protease [Staphylococcus lugdunensis]MCH8673576.1 FMN-binding negative transcriptional regulator [Staphylococcus lugdunensis]MCH8675330.1 FMN-binding negative transcriptional regulator [Staphylococcus lugdunensis]MCI2752506.1 FMN-binding negative transcriptional regulator [Staphylococcus lugdunensis]